MSLRFGLGTAFALAGGFLVAASLAFSPSTVGWLAFGVGAGVAVLATGALARNGISRGTYGYAAAFAVGLWSLVAALIFTGNTLTWLVFADALALVAVALADLGLHEISTERVVHTLEVHDSGQVVQAA
jgi:hypothetical protein